MESEEKFMKKLLSIVLIIGLVLGLAACTPADGGTTAATTAAAAEATTTAAETTAAAGEKIKIGYACPNINNTFQTYLVDAAKAYAEKNNVELIVVDGQQDVIMQQDQVKALIEQGVQALMVTPADTSAMEPVTAAAKEAGIPLVYFNTNPYSDGNMPEGTYYVGSQEVTAGELQMGYAGEKLGGKGNVAILMGGLTYEASFERSQGVKNIIESKYPDIKVLAEETAEWQREKAVSVVENWITAYGDDLDAIFANNDEMALGAINALQAAGISDVMVFGIDATPDGVKAIEDGTLTATVFQDAKGQSEGAMDFAIKAIKKEAITESVNWIPYVLVTKDNVAQYK
jgi:ABC-type sugar transport system substrate-binding protein